MNKMINITNLSFAYPGMPLVLQNVNLSIATGDYLAIVGSNGSAKTTLLKLILGILRPQAGSIEILGKDNALFREWHKIGYVPQRTSFFNPNFPATVQEIVGLGMTHQGRKALNKKRIGEVLELVDLANKQSRKIGDLSGGELQRVLIARSLINSPEMLFLDEPTANLDLVSQQKLLELLDFLNVEMGIGIVIVTHDPEVIKKASRIIKVKKGQILELAPRDWGMVAGGDEHYC